MEKDVTDNDYLMCSIVKIWAADCSVVIQISEQSTQTHYHYSTSSIKSALPAAHETSEKTLPFLVLSAVSTLLSKGRLLVGTHQSTC